MSGCLNEEKDIGREAVNWKDVDENEVEEAIEVGKFDIDFFCVSGALESLLCSEDLQHIIGSGSMGSVFKRYLGSNFVINLIIFFRCQLAKIRSQCTPKAFVIGSIGSSRIGIKIKSC